jgi:hypothetical protein
MKAIQYTGKNINAVISFAGKQVYLTDVIEEQEGTIPRKVKGYKVKTPDGDVALNKHDYIIYHKGQFSVVREDVFRAMQTFGEAYKTTKEEKEYSRLYNNLIMHDFTKIYEDYGYKYGSPHHFKIMTRDEQVDLAEIHFQEGPIKSAGVNGVMNEDLIAIILRRLYCFQRTEYACKENEMAIQKLEEAMMWINKRTLDRKARKVEGTHKI